MPAEFRELFRRHPKLCYTLLFRESAGSLTDLAADPQHLGGELGMTGILQTWTRDLRDVDSVAASRLPHPCGAAPSSLSVSAPPQGLRLPHIHYLVPGGALTKTGWVRPRHPNVLVPAKPLAVRMRNR